MDYVLYGCLAVWFRSISNTQRCSPFIFSKIVTLRVQSFAGRNFRGYKLSRTREAKINFRGYKLSRLVGSIEFAGINFRERPSWTRKFACINFRELRYQVLCCSKISWIFGRRQTNRKTLRQTNRKTLRQTNRKTFRWSLCKWSVDQMDEIQLQISGCAKLL